jgi:hypothetical protein
VVTEGLVAAVSELAVATDAEEDSEMVDDDEGKEETALGMNECDTTEEMELVVPDDLCPEAVIVAIMIDVFDMLVEVVVVAEVVKELELAEGDNDSGMDWVLLGLSLSKFHGCCGCCL